MQRCAECLSSSQNNNSQENRRRKGKWEFVMTSLCAPTIISCITHPCHSTKIYILPHTCIIWLVYTNCRHAIRSQRGISCSLVVYESLLSIAVHSLPVLTCVQPSRKATDHGVRWSWTIAAARLWQPFLQLLSLSRPVLQCNVTVTILPCVILHLHNQ